MDFLVLVRKGNVDIWFLSREQILFYFYPAFFVRFIMKLNSNFLYGGNFSFNENDFPVVFIVTLFVCCGFRSVSLPLLLPLTTLKGR